MPCYAEITGYEKQAYECLKRSTGAIDPHEQRLWRAFALEFLDLIVAARDLSRNARPRPPQLAASSSFPAS